MREVSVSRFVQTYPETVDETLSPETVLSAEGSFEIRGVDDNRVTVGGYGLELVFEFTRGERELEYDQVQGPLETLTTTLTYGPEDEGTRLTAQSTVAVGGPGVVDRIAAWKRRGELRRALDGIASRLE